MRSYRRLSLHLLAEEEQELRTLLRGGVQQVRVVVRALALLRLSEGQPVAVAASNLELTAKAVRAIGWRYLSDGFERALYERSRPGAISLLSAAERQRIIAMVCSDPPDGQARWTVRLVAREAVQRKLVPKVGRETIRILLESHALKPWRKKMWCVAELNAEYVHKMEGVLAIYERPYNAAEPVVCLDEKPVTLHQDVRPAKPAAPGHLAKRDNEYKRCGTANVFCAVEPKAGRHFTEPTPRRSALEFARVVAQIAISYPAAKTIHLVLDNLNIHCRKSLIRCYGEECGNYLWERFSVHYTPKHGSWLNQAEIEISLSARQCLGRRRIPSLAMLHSQAQAWNQEINRARTKIDWQFSRQDARRKLGYRKNQFRPSEN
jgi:hypothetical protein